MIPIECNHFQLKYKVSQTKLSQTKQIKMSELFNQTVMCPEVFDKLTKPRNVNSKHFQYMTVAYWFIHKLRQTMDLSPEQVESMENAMGVRSSPSELKAIYSEFEKMQSEIAKEVAKELTMASHAESKKKTALKKSAKETAVAEKPKRKYTKKNVTDSSSDSDANGSDAIVAEKPKRKYTKKAVAVEPVSEVACEVVPEPNGEMVSVVTEKPKRKYTKKAVAIPSDEQPPIVKETPAEVSATTAEVDPVPKPKKRVTKKVTIKEASEPATTSEPEVPKKRGPKKKIDAPNSATETMLQTIHSFEEILNNMALDEIVEEILDNMESDDDESDDDLALESYQ
jgi:hypothetical protein